MKARFDYVTAAPGAYKAMLGLEQYLHDCGLEGSLIHLINWKTMRFLLRLLLNGVAVLIAAWLIPGLDITSPATAIVAGIVLGLINAVIRPVLILLTLPLTLVTLGLFIFVVNAVCLALAAWVVPGFTISGFGAAFAGALVTSVVSWLLSALLVDKNRR